MSQKILISAGEASGDLHAANMLRVIKQKHPDIKAYAMGGDKLREAGAEVKIDCAELAVIGLIEVLKNYRKIKAALEELKTFVREERPDLVILVDYQEFNMKLSAYAKSLGVKTLFYIGPQVWAWRSHRVNKMRERIDMMAVLFPFEVDFYEEANVPVRFVGNPLVDEVYATSDKQALLDKFELSQIASDKKIVGLFPGSRKSEIKRLLPTQFAAAATLASERSDIHFVLAVASTLSKQDLAEQVKELEQQYGKLSISLIKDKSYDIMHISDAVITASGTATLEMALMQVPFVIVYKTAWLTYHIVKRMIKIDNIGLVNIVAEKQIIKELIQAEANSQAIADEVNKLLDEPSYRQKMINNLSAVKAKLGKSGGSEAVADLAIEMLVS